MCAAVGHFCNGSHKVFRFEAPMKFGVHVVCPQAQVNEAVVLVHYIVQHSVLLFGPVVQAGVLLTEAIAKAHCQFKLCFCQECVGTIPQALELHNRLHACNHGCMAPGSIFFITARRAGARCLHSPPLAPKKA